MLRRSWARETPAAGTSSAKLISGSRFGAASSSRKCFASSRQGSLSERSSRSASCASDNANCHPSHSARNATISGLFAGPEGRTKRKTRPALPSVVSAILVCPAAGERCQQASPRMVEKSSPTRAARPTSPSCPPPQRRATLDFIFRLSTGLTPSATSACDRAAIAPRSSPPLQGEAMTKVDDILMLCCVSAFFAGVVVAVTTLPV